MFEKRSNKKGQITIFIIIGVIAVIAVGMGLYLQSKGIIDIGREARPFVEEVPVQARPVSDFVEGCLEQVAVDGLRLIGDHGGYIDWHTIPGLEMVPGSPTDSNAIAFYSGSEMVLPYWWYMSSENDCEKSNSCRFDSKRPPLYREEGAMSIEGQLDDYVNENIAECLRGFEAFKIQKFEVKELESPKTKTSVTEHAVVFELEYPLEIAKGNLKHTVMNYFVEIPLNLKEIYHLGWNITRLQSEYTIFEKYVQHLISLYGEVDKNALPPISGFEVTFSGATKWEKKKVLEKLQTVIMSTMPMLQVAGSKNYKPPYVPDDSDWAGTVKSLYTIHSMFDVGEEAHPSLEVTFNYFPHWKPYFDLNCNGESCEPEAASVSLFESFGLNRYNFVYDISYPVFVDITNPYAFKEQGYSFKFFIEANLRNNVPITAVAPPAPARRPTGSILCDDIHRTTPLKAIVLDAKENSILDGVEIIFRCGQSSCALGKTVNGVVEGKVPNCIGAQLYASKRDYLAKWAALDVVSDDPIERTLHLEPYQKIDFVGKRYLFRKVAGVGWRFYPEPDNLKPTENMVINLNRKQFLGDGKFNVVSEVAGGRDPGDRARDVTIIPGTYEVNVQVMTRDTIYIPGDPPTVYNNTNPLMEGGVRIESWSLTEDMLKNAKAIQFNAYVYDLAGVLPESSRTLEDTSLAINLVENTQRYLTVLKPKIILER